MGFVEPWVALAVSFCFLGVLLYKRVNLGITLTAAALLLALLSLDWKTIPGIIYATTTDALTISVVLATFAVMLLSQLYKETKLVNDLSESASGLINNSMVVSSMIPAVVGFLPVAGGALMSAPLVDRQTEELGLNPEKKAYVNLWFRHAIYPVYPISQVLIVTSALTGIALPLIVLRQIPVVIVMIIVGYFFAFRKIATKKSSSLEGLSRAKGFGRKLGLRDFFVAFSPILIMIILVFLLDFVGLGLAKLGFDLVIAAVVGLLTLIMISRPSPRVIAKPLRNWEIYGISLAAYAAFLLRNVIAASGISEIFRASVVGSVDITVILVVVPAFLGFATGSTSGGIAVSVSILAGVLTFTPSTASLLYMSAYLGYIIVPTHLCFAFTVGYFKCSMRCLYKYLIPSFLVSLATALLVYFFI